MAPRLTELDFHLIEAGWGKVLGDAIEANSSVIRIMCPFIKKKTVERLLLGRRPENLQVITRFSLSDFCAGVSDIEALELLLRRGAKIRGIKNLHSKVYLLGSCAIVTSANLTESALSRNHEFGFVSEDPEIVAECQKYFDSYWRRSSEDLIVARLSDWKRKVTAYLASGAHGSAPELGDYGLDMGISNDPIRMVGWVKYAGQAYVKFFGEGDNRADRQMEILDEIRHSGSHWACAYPKGRRPRQVRDGALIFMGRLVRDPNDIIIYGRAVGMSHLDWRDDATSLDIQQRSWKEDWPHYVRVHHAEFVSGELSSGISLLNLMNEFGANSFVSTRRNSLARVGNTDPRRAYMQQPSVELTQEAAAWLNDRLNHAFLHSGKLTKKELGELDWPIVPVAEVQR